MARIVVLGAGLTGLAAALVLARDGHQVRVLERDPAEPVGEAEDLWKGWWNQEPRWTSRACGPSSTSSPQRCLATPVPRRELRSSRQSMRRSGRLPMSPVDAASATCVEHRSVVLIEHPNRSSLLSCGGTDHEPAALVSAWHLDVPNGPLL
jgi:cation diffusion facilitator CzcD-associated flavoprotein CzcO